MNPLNHQTIDSRPSHPERIIQFGGGNFLRAFVDWMVDIMNERVDFDSSVVIVKPTPRGTYQALADQDGLFHTLVRGIENGELVQHTRLISCVSRSIQPYQEFEEYLKLAELDTVRFIVSNTTEAGIEFQESETFSDQPCLSFPGKLTQLLYRRFEYVEGALDKGFIVLPCELIGNNGGTLKKYVLQYADLWELGTAFKDWIEEANVFCNTLVDRIVTGYPKKDAPEILEKLGYEDQLLVAAEPYYVWVIEDPHRRVAKELPALHARLNIQFVDDLAKHRTLKVRILNGAHTAMVPVGYLNGLRTVKESMDHEQVGMFIQQLIYNDILPTLDYSEAEKVSYAQAVLDRFKNPFIEHFLSDIALNSISKFKTRLAPSLFWYNDEEERPHIPEYILKALAALITFYKGEWKGSSLPVRDNPTDVDFFKKAWGESNSTNHLVESVLETHLNGVVTLSDQLINQLTFFIDQEAFIFE